MLLETAVSLDIYVREESCLDCGETPGTNMEFIKSMSPGKLDRRPWCRRGAALNVIVPSLTCECIVCDHSSFSSSMAVIWPLRARAGDDFFAAFEFVP